MTAAISNFWVFEYLTASSGKEEELSIELGKLAVHCRLEPGCISYELFKSKANPSQFIVVMGWKSAADYTAHNESSNVEKFVKNFKDELYIDSHVKEEFFDKI